MDDGLQTSGVRDGEVAGDPIDPSPAVVEQDVAGGWVLVSLRDRSVVPAHYHRYIHVIVLGFTASTILKLY